MSTSDISVLMISLDPGFSDSKSGSGNVLDRHKAYASHVKSLDVIHLGGNKRKTHEYDHGLTVHSTGKSGLRNLKLGRQLARSIIAKKNIQLIVAQDPHATGSIGHRLKREFNIPLIVGFHGDFWNNPNWKREQFKNRIYNVIQKRIVAAADGIRVVSKGIHDKLVSAGVSESKIQIINTPINDIFSEITNTQKKVYDDIRHKYKGKVLLLFVGRFVDAKNLPFMLEVFKKTHEKLKKTHLIMIGDGHERSTVEDILEEKGLADAVSLTGNIDHDALVAYYRAADVLLLLSTNESFGKVIIEAGIAGTPALASETTGAQSIIDEGKTGFLVPINDLEASYEVLCELIEDHKGAEQLGVNARRDYLERFSSARSIHDIVQFWTSVISQ